METTTQAPIFPDAPEAATRRTITGWVSRNGRFFGEDESLARWEGATAVRCEKCQQPTDAKYYTKCEKCREEGADEKFAKAGRAPYTEGMLFSDSHDRYFEDPAEAREFAEDEGVTLESMRLYLCTPNMARHLDDDFFCYEVPDELRIALDAFNAAVKAYGRPLSWSPSGIALDTATV
jgi:hypothetical protein